jgi:putative PIN family toxin of toxin-antitoxin system
MIVVLDTNIIVSALLSTSGPPAEIMRRWEADEFSGITSPPILDELAHVINYPKITNLLDLSHEEDIRIHRPYVSGRHGYRTQNSPRYSTK